MKKKKANFHFGNGRLKQVFCFYNHHKEACPWVALSRCRQARWAWQPLQGRSSLFKDSFCLNLFCFNFAYYYYYVGCGPGAQGPPRTVAVRWQTWGVHSPTREGTLGTRRVLAELLSLQWNHCPLPALSSKSSHIALPALSDSWPLFSLIVVNAYMCMYIHIYS